MGEKEKKTCLEAPGAGLRVGVGRRQAAHHEVHYILVFGESKGDWRGRCCCQGLFVSSSYDGRKAKTKERSCVHKIVGGYS